MKIKPLIEIKQENIIECQCGVTIPYSKKREELMWKYINRKCNNCNKVLLTRDEFTKYKRLMRYVRFLNKWFSWLTIFERKGKEKVITNVIFSESSKEYNNPKHHSNLTISK